MYRETPMIIKATINQGTLVYPNDNKWQLNTRLDYQEQHENRMSKFSCANKGEW